MAAPYYTTLAHVFTNVRNKYQLDSTTLPDSVLLPYAQKRFREMLANVYKLNRSYYADILNFSLVADQTEYTKPIDSGTSNTAGGGLVKILRLDVSFSGKAVDWTQATAVDEKTIPSIDLYNETQVNQNFSFTNPFFYELDKSFFLLPYPTSNTTYGNTLQGSTGVNQGFLYAIIRPAEFVDSTSIPNIDVEFLGVLEDGLTVDVAEMLFGQGSSQAKAAIQNYFGIKDPETGVATGMAAMIENYSNKNLAGNWGMSSDPGISYR